MEEVHLFIIWSNANYKKKQIIEDINYNFTILDIINVKWSKEKFSENLSRFYGENLPKNSHKEKHCGNGVFTCIIIKDKHPKYDLRLTSKGNKIVNINTFDKKQLYRQWTGGGHKIHATDNINETKIQLALLFGVSYKKYLKSDRNLKEKNYNKDLKGANGWESFEELFSILNYTDIPYVVLRNFENLDVQLNSLHPDVDLLVEQKNVIKNIINGKKRSNKQYRVQYNVVVGGKNINFDLRFIGDNYYDKKWEINILKHRKQYKTLFVPNREDLLYSLIYHALLHKKNISKDYIKKIERLCEKVGKICDKDFFIEEKIFKFLVEYLTSKSYNIVEPTDLSVYFNFNLINKFIYIETSKRRLFFEKKQLLKKNIKSKIKKILNKIKEKE